MSTVFVNIGLSLDGYMAPEGMTMGKPEYKNWGAKWGALMAWVINQQYFRENLKNLREPGPQFRIDRVLDGPAATHLRYVHQ
jgi:hypothetical protein